MCGLIDEDFVYFCCYVLIVVESFFGFNWFVVVWFGGLGEGYDDVGIWIFVCEFGGSWIFLV